MEKIKFLTIGRTKWTSENLKEWNEVIEEHAPDLYEIIYEFREKEVLKQLKEFRPQVIMLTSLKNTLDWIKTIKQLYPEKPIFVIGREEDEELFDEFMACGAYKCYLPPFASETMMHDIHVALNLE